MRDLAVLYVSAAVCSHCLFSVLCSSPCAAPRASTFPYRRRSRCRPAPGTMRSWARHGMAQTSLHHREYLPARSHRSEIFQSMVAIYGPRRVEKLLPITLRLSSFLERRDDDGIQTSFERSCRADFNWMSGLKWLGSMMCAAARDACVRVSCLIAGVDDTTHSSEAAPALFQIGQERYRVCVLAQAASDCQLSEPEPEAICFGASGCSDAATGSNMVGRKGRTSRLSTTRACKRRWRRSGRVNLGNLRSEMGRR